MVASKMVLKNGTDKMMLIKSSINPAANETMIFFNYPASTLTPLGFLCVFIANLWFLVTKYNLNSMKLKSIKKLLHFVHTILFIPFYRIPFCPYTILSVTILSGHRFKVHLH